MTLINDVATQIILRPFETGDLSWPKTDVLYLNARSGADFSNEERSQIYAVQPERSAFIALENSNIKTAPVYEDVEDKRFDLSLMLVARQHRENAHLILLAIKKLNDDGVLIIAGAKRSGVEKLAKQCAQIDCLDGKLSKSHGLVFWIKITPENRVTLQNLFAETDDAAVIGAFHGGAADKGSEFLSSHWPDKMGWDIADFGAGTGFLSQELLKHTGKIETLDLYESHFHALEAARSTVAPLFADAAFHWHDVIAEPIKKRYDWIITNPPFHDTLGRTDPKLGIMFLLAAYKALKMGGRLLIVANRDLPYEEPLTAIGADVSALASEGGFKILLVKRKK